MLTGELRSQIDRVWNSIWSGGTSSPLEFIEQITDLLILRRLDELHQLKENKANRLGTPIDRGLMAPQALYELPFRDINPLGPDRLFDPAMVDQLVAALGTIRTRRIALGSGVPQDSKLPWY